MSALASLWKNTIESQERSPLLVGSEALILKKKMFVSIIFLGLFMFMHEKGATEKVMFFSRVKGNGCPNQSFGI